MERGWWWECYADHICNAQVPHSDLMVPAQEGWGLASPLFCFKFPLYRIPWLWIGFFSCQVLPCMWNLCCKHTISWEMLPCEWRTFLGQICYLGSGGSYERDYLAKRESFESCYLLSCFNLWVGDYATVVTLWTEDLLRVVSLPARNLLPHITQLASKGSSGQLLPCESRINVLQVLPW